MKSEIRNLNDPDWRSVLVVAIRHSDFTLNAGRAIVEIVMHKRRAGTIL